MGGGKKNMLLLVNVASGERVTIEIKSSVSEGFAVFLLFSIPQDA